MPSFDNLSGLANGPRIDLSGISTSAASVDKPWWQRISDSASLAGTNMSIQATPLNYYIDSQSSGKGDHVINDEGDYLGDVPQGDYSSLDKSGYDQAQWEFERQMELLAAQREFNSAEAEKNRQWQERMSNTAYQRAVEDLEKAGLNKWLAITGGNGASASTPSGSTATSSAGDASAPNPQIYKMIIQMISNMSSSAMKILGNIIGAAF